MDVSICIVNWNTRELLCRCLESVQTRTKGVSYEIIVVDNDSADGSADAVRTRFPDVKLILPRANLGFARGCNLGASHATGRHVLYLNPDTELVSDAITGMVKVLDEHQDVGAVGCRLLNSDGSIQFTCASDFPSGRNEICSLLGFDRLFPGVAMFSARELGYWNHEDSRDVECLSGACMMLRRELVERLGGFDETLFMYAEDLDLCARVASSGGRLFYLASEVMYHHEGAGSRKRGKDFAPARQRAGNYYFLRKQFGLLRAMRYRTAVFWGSAARCAAMAVVSAALIALRHARRENATFLFARYGRLAMWAVGLWRVSLPDAPPAPATAAIERSHSAAH